MNKVILIGNLGSDSQARQTQNGTYVLNLRLATNERRKNGEQWEDHTEWHDVTIFGKRAESLAQFLFKGMKIGIEGHLETQTWDDKQTGTKRWRTTIIAEDVELLSPRQDQAQRPAAPPQAQRPAQAPPAGWRPPPAAPPAPAQGWGPPPAQQPGQAAPRPPGPPTSQDSWGLAGPPSTDPPYAENPYTEDPFNQYGSR